MIKNSNDFQRQLLSVFAFDLIKFFLPIRLELFYFFSFRCSNLYRLKQLACCVYVYLNVNFFAEVE